MPAVHPAMDGDYAPHDPPQAGNILYSLPHLQGPLCGPSLEVSQTLTASPWEAACWILS
uniref:Uncharacterized protein n=1 Tax=Sarcophilus harrisii TaxID=9305 RepID=A0A7N4PR99_SARHA